MSESLARILQAINKVVNEQFVYEGEESPKIISSGKKYSGWAIDRLVYEHKILINAIVEPHGVITRSLDSVTGDIIKELGQFLPVAPLRYPFDDINIMGDRIIELVEHFGGNLTVTDVIDRGPNPRREDVTGYLIISILRFPKIV